jgi:hypothetical protein
VKDNMNKFEKDLKEVDKMKKEGEGDGNTEEEG